MMKKTVCILILSFALLSVNSFAQSSNNTDIRAKVKEQMLKAQLKKNHLKQIIMGILASPIYPRLFLEF